MGKVTIINRRKYEVEYVFNMVGNYDFVDKDGVHHLVDAGDVTEWLDDEDAPKGLAEGTGVDAAIAYAKYYSELSEEGYFWWKRYRVEKDFIHGTRHVDV